MRPWRLAQASDIGAGLRPFITGPRSARADLNRLLTLFQRAEVMPIAVGEASFNLVLRPRKSAGIPAGSRPSTLATVRTADAMSWRRRSVMAAAETAARMSARVAREGEACDMGCLVMTETVRCALS